MKAIVSPLRTAGDCARPDVARAVNKAAVTSQKPEWVSFESVLVNRMVSVYHKLVIFRQPDRFIPNPLEPRLARATGAEQKSPTFKPWSHVVSLRAVEFTRAVLLNDVCNSLRLHSGLLPAIRDATSAQPQWSLHFPTAAPG